MTTIIFIHGINNEKENAAKIKSDWLAGLMKGFASADIDFPDIGLVAAPFYGKLLDKETENWKPSLAEVVSMSASSNLPINDHSAALYREFQELLKITDQEVRQFSDEALVEMGEGYNKSWVLAIARAMEDILPTKGKFLANKFLPQAFAYLNKPGLKDKVDEIVRETIVQNTSDDLIIISHSLGTVSAYRVLKKLKDNIKVKLFITVGSPLGIKIIQKKIPMPRLVPRGVNTWFNGADKADFVALRPELNAHSFGNDAIINNTNFNNLEEDKHSIISYLSQSQIPIAIHNRENIDFLKSLKTI